MSKPIYVLCLHNVRTGGPEAIHQLSDTLIEQGFDARMVYYDWGQIAALESASAQDGYRFGARENPIEEYARYKVNVTDHVPNVEGVIVVLPETLCHLAPKFDKATVLIWWLSVDNGFGALSRVNLNHLRRPGVFHAAQSHYANRLICALKLSPPAGAFLTDYTLDMRELAPPLPWDERDMLVVINSGYKVTADVTALAADVRRTIPQASCYVLPHGKSRREIAEVFAKARVFVDLGSMPGKDRLPREALVMGCGVLTDSHNGAGDEFWGASIEGNEDAVPNIMALLGQAREPDERLLRHERQKFEREVRTVFSDL